MPQISAYRRYWKKHPPTHLLVAAFMGYEAKKAGDPQDLVNQFQGKPHGR